MGTNEKGLQQEDLEIKIICISPVSSSSEK